ncbi:MAG TPA: MATE family efflux transporter, partial [Phycisphaerales bacterium]|nr:MATE family efflux transporter [Phycisphaerales bacterium]
MDRGGTSSLGDDRGGSDPKGQSTGAADPPASRPLPTSAVDPATLDPSQENGLPSARSLRRGSAGITPDGRLRSGRLAGLSMGAAILTLAWPILAESFLGSLVGLTDTYLSAQISEAATDAIAGASYVMWFIGLVVMSVASGATALVSRAIGASRLAVANAALAQSLVLGLLAGAGVGGLVALLAPLGATALSLHGEAREAFLTYMWIIAGGVPGISILAIGIACARGAGDSVRPLVSMVIVNIVNMCASVLLRFGTDAQK